MAEAAYQPTTEPISPKQSRDCNKIQLGFKGLQLLLSLVAFICEEIIDKCESCAGLYIYEFVSCSAFLISILMCVVYFTPLKKKINIPSFKKVDFYITLCTGVLFFIASIVFIATIEKTELAKVSVAFGFLASFAFLFELYIMWKENYLKREEKLNQAVPVNGEAEGQPLNTPVQENRNV